MQPPPPSAGSMALRKFLLLGIIVACVGLGGAIGWRLWQKMHGKEKVVIDVQGEFDKIMDRGKDASKAIFSIETKVWGKGQELTAEDFAAIKTELGKLITCEDELRKLLDLLRAKNFDESAEKQMILPKWIQTRMWIIDASDLLENQKPPDYGGLNVPMFLTSDKIRKAQEELKEINTTKDDVIKENNPEKIKATRKRISELRETFRVCSVKLQDLDKYVGEGLSRPDLTSKEVVELDQLREDANKATMAIKASGLLLQAFPE
jgi:hypothetical protein